jgi:hypothetical protein
MEVRLRYFDGCPNWRTAYERLDGGLGAATGEGGSETP